MFSFDETDPRFLIIYTGAEHAEPDDYHALNDRWIAKLAKGERFGVIMVNLPGDDEHEHHDDEEHRQHEAEMTRIINDFRRDYRDRCAQVNTGYARVVPEAWLTKYYANDLTAIQQAVEHIDRYAQYNWGIPGNGFISIDDAKTWLLGLLDQSAASTPSDLSSSSGEGRVGLFFGSSSGITEYIADEVIDAWKAAGMATLEPINIGYSKDLGAMLDYQYLILGIPTWNIGQLQDDWEILFPQLDSLDFSGRKVAIFGVGDQYGYPDNFIDAVGILGEKLLERGAHLVGYWYDEHYEFSESRAFVDGKFMGLGIDDLNQSKLNDQRIQGWVRQLISEFALQPSAV